MKTLIRGGRVLRSDPGRPSFEPGFVLVEDDRIVAIGPPSGAPSDSEVNHVEDATDCLVVPGLINSHQHHWYHLLKGTSEGLQLEDWVERVLIPATAALQPDDLVVSMRLAAADMLASGTTTFFNHSVTETTAATVSAIATASTATGIRQVFGKEVRATPGSSDSASHRAEIEALLETYRGNVADSLFSLGLAVETGEHWIRSGAMTAELAGYVAGLAERYDVRVSDHITGGTLDRSVTAFRRRTGMGQVVWLTAHGLLTERSLLAHAVWIDEAEIGLVAHAGATIVTCPSSSAFTAGGIPPVRGWLAAEVNVALGSDGPMVNDTVDLLALLRECFLLQNVKYLRPAAVPLADLWALATGNAARGLGATGSLGELAVGAKADLAIFDLRHPRFGAALNPLVNLVLSGSGHDATLVMVDGRILKHQGRLLSVDVAEVLRDSYEVARALVARAGIDARVADR